MNGSEIRKAFKIIALEYSDTTTGEKIIYQFLNRIMALNTNEDIEKILTIWKKSKGVK